MEKQITYKQYIAAQDKLAKLQNEQQQAMRDGDQAKLDAATQKAVKQFDIIANYKDQQAQSR